MPAGAPTLTLEVLRAQHGDCLLVRYGTEIVLIDGGPSGVYDEALRPRLDELGQELGEPVWLQTIMVSHIDDDHIVGLADMFADAREREDLHRGSRRWEAGELWFNAFKSLTGAGGGPSSAQARSAAMQALVASAPGGVSRAVAAGVKTGNALAEDADALGVPLNTSFGGGLVVAAEVRPTVVEPVAGLRLTVLAPDAGRLAKLRAEWEEWEHKHSSADAQTAANLDRSVFNLSSIVVLAEADGRSLLLTGDARSDDVLDGLERGGRLAADGPPLTVDVLKLPHHGSLRNVNARFFERVRARHYVISANGRDGNPDDGALALLCDARAGDATPWTLWLTYGGTLGDGRDSLHERLAAFFAERRRMNQRVDVRFAAEGARHDIVLPAP